MSEPSALLATMAASKIIREWPSNRAFSADEAIEEHGGQTLSSSVRIELIYEEFCREEDAGNEPNEQDYLSRYPVEATDLSRLLRFHRSVTEATTIHWPVEGDQFGRYQLKQFLGCGSFSRVFLATDPALGDRHCVIKVTDGIEGEGRILGPLRHRSIVKVDNVVQGEGGLQGLVMRYRQALPVNEVFKETTGGKPHEIGPEDLAEAIEQADLPGDLLNQEIPPYRSDREFFLDLVCAITEGLAAVHKTDVYHGDIKPSNLLIAADATPLFIDFNLARDGVGAARGGTRTYFAPEQASAFASNDAVPLSAMTDVYALAAVVIELLAGARWPVGDVHGDVLHDYRLDRLADVEERFGKAWAAELRQAIAFDPQKRTSSAVELASRLRRIQRVERRQRQAKRAAAVAAVLACMIAIGFTALWKSPEQRVAEAWDKFRQEKYEEGLNSLSSLSEEEISTPEDRLIVGLSKVQAGDYVSGTELIEHAAEELKIPLAIEARAAALIARGTDMEAARKAIATANRLSPNNPRVLNNLAFARIGVGDRSGAWTLLEEASALQPNSPQIAYNQAECENAMTRRGEQPAQREYFDRAITLNPSAAEPYWLKAQVVLREDGEDSVEARELITMAIDRGLYPERFSALAGTYPTLFHEMGLSVPEIELSDLARRQQMVNLRVMFPAINEVIHAMHLLQLDGDQSLARLRGSQ